MTIIAGKPLEHWQREIPQLPSIMKGNETFWVNPRLAPCAGRHISPDLDASDINDAESRLLRFAPYLAKVFPETRPANGIIESPLQEIPQMLSWLMEHEYKAFQGRLFIKQDNALPISGSIKARGGIYEVLAVAEKIALDNGVISLDSDYACLAEPRCRELFSRYSIMVGSTGNLGLSIGIMSAKLGFKVVVHMSADAKQWKKDMLREKGAIVIEYQSDYGVAVEQGRKEAKADPNCHFVDDENSATLFLGYAVAANRLKKQLAESGITISAQSPLIVYLPCGVGGAPGGITFGLRTVFGDHAHCFFAEPTRSPAMLLGLATGLHNQICVQDFGLDNRTEADGLAVARPSGFVGKTLEKDISGAFTISDSHLYPMLRALIDTENIRLEPSALAGFTGPGMLFSTPEGQEYCAKYLGGAGSPALDNATHVLWGTGGGMVPPAIMEEFYNRGKS